MKSLRMLICLALLGTVVLAARCESSDSSDSDEYYFKCTLIDKDSSDGTLPSINIYWTGGYAGAMTPGVPEAEYDISSEMLDISVAKTTDKMFGDVEDYIDITMVFDINDGGVHIPDLQTGYSYPISFSITYNNDVLSADGTLTFSSITDTFVGTMNFITEDYKSENAKLRIKRTDVD